MCLNSSQIASVSLPEYSNLISLHSKIRSFFRVNIIDLAIITKTKSILSKRGSLLSWDSPVVNNIQLLKAGLANKELRPSYC